MKTLHFNVSHWGLCQSQPNTHLGDAAKGSPPKRRRLSESSKSGTNESNHVDKPQSGASSLSKRLRTLGQSQTQLTHPAPRLPSNNVPLSSPPNFPDRKLSFTQLACNTIKNRVVPNATASRVQMMHAHLLQNSVPQETAIKLSSLYIKHKERFAKIIDGYANSSAITDIKAFRINTDGYKEPCSAQYKAAQTLVYDALLTESSERTLPQLHKDLSRLIDSVTEDENLTLTNPERIALILTTAIQSGACLDHGLVFDNFQSTSDDCAVKNDEFYMDPVWLCAQSSNLDALTALKYIGRDIDAPVNKHHECYQNMTDTEGFNHSVLYELCTNHEDYGDDVDLAKHLVELGANFTKSTPYTPPPLMAAVGSGKARISDFFLKQMKKQDIALSFDEAYAIKSAANSLEEPKRTLMLDIVNNALLEQKSPSGQDQQSIPSVSEEPCVEFQLEPETDDMCVEFTEFSHAQMFQADEKIFQNLSGRSWM